MTFRQPESPAVSDIAQVVIFHTQVDDFCLECLGQRRNSGVPPDILLHGAGQSLLKGRKPKTLRKANEPIDRYIYFYNHERIQTKTGVAPLSLRHSASNVI